MSLKPPPIQGPIVNNAGVVTNPWALFFSAIHKLLNNQQPQQLPSYTVSGAPAAANWDGHIIYVSDESGGETVAFSDGTNWRRVQDRAIIS